MVPSSQKEKQTFYFLMEVYNTNYKVVSLKKKPQKT
jgi:hypothetical protein